ncbi:hypothetical protein SAMN05444369_10883 [Capnocytophaga haemolytica]|jgi:hypothetical protein|uniref:EF-hand domain-containing protein n=1 Tax=Capnocytophaga haemolytica TaxID=45243 RepID=A0AAX2GZX3_9FLAO|nr:hypothetical protein [Capnocytophaga haemolytica]AMD84118.1 hypothetical protein AXF12_00325 [Capnocytophaga haemolytica]SFO07153.1 hypothetical protein SAMN05444369_10883 [Capnocytophaga haemolytica]SNV13314.1 Uncharacterised protein [Capnocytophaga haemolytica]
MSKPKNVKCRAFRISTNNFTDNAKSIFSLLCEQLPKSKANERRMRLNTKDESREEDLICDYEISEGVIFGTLLRIKSSDNIPEIPEEVFEENIVHLEQLRDLDVNSSLFYKDHYYFLLNDKYLIVTLRGNITITHFQTYTNWLLESLRANTLFEFTPIIKENPNISLSDLKSLRIQDPVRKEEDNFDLTETKSISFKLLREMLTDVLSFDEVKASEVISAELLLKFSKPKKMKEKDYQNYFGAQLKPISDLENVTFITKKGKTIKGDEMQEMQEFKVETTDSGKISEPELKQAMEKYLRELEKCFN